MDVVHYLRTLRRRWRVIAVLGVLGAVAGFLLIPRPTTAKNDGNVYYLATQTLITNSASKGQAAATGQLTLDQMMLGIQQGDVAQRVAQRLGGVPSALDDRIHAAPNQQLGTIQLTARGDEPTETATLAATFGEELIEWVTDVQRQRVQNELNSAEGILAERQADLAAVLGNPGASEQDVKRAEEEVRSAQDNVSNSNAALAAPAPLLLLDLNPAQPAALSQVQKLFNSNTAAASGNDRNSATQAVTAADVLSDAPSGGLGLPAPLALVVGGFGGFLMGVAIVLVMATLDPRVFTKEQAEAAFGFPVVAEIPAFSRRQQRETEIISHTSPYSRFAEAFRVLRSSILFVERSGKLTNQGALAPGEKRASVIMVTSPGPSEGKTTTACNLAAVLAEDGSQVLLVNCDFRRPRLHLFLESSHEPRKVMDTEIPGVKFVAGVVEDHHTATPAEVVKAQRDVVNAARSVFDYILLDTAPLLTTNDASDVLSATDMVIVVCRAGKTTKEAADRGAELLERFNAPVVGAALVAAVEAPSARYYYYYASESLPDESTKSPLADLVNGRSGEAPEADDAAGDDVELATAQAEQTPAGDSAPA